MPLVSMIELLRSAREDAYGVPAFNVIGIEYAEAIVRGAEVERAPVILQLSQNAVNYHFGAVEPIGAACRAIADGATVPVALHLDHATSRDLCERALRVGFGSVMYDAATSSLEENTCRVAELASWAHGRGSSLEGALGVVGGKDGLHTKSG